MINGEEFRYVSKQQFQDSFFLGSSCGQEFSFQVIAIGAGGARSFPSTPFPYKQPNCELYAEVEFESFVVTFMDHNEQPSLKFDISTSVAGNKRTFYTVESYAVNINQRYQFSQFRSKDGAPVPYIFPIDNPDSNPVINIYALFWDLNRVGPIEWDTDVICKYTNEIPVKHILSAGFREFSGNCPNAQMKLGENEYLDQEGKITINYTVRVFQTPSD